MWYLCNVRKSCITVRSEQQAVECDVSKGCDSADGMASLPTILYRMVSIRGSLASDIGIQPPLSLNLGTMLIGSPSPSKGPFTPLTAASPHFIRPASAPSSSTLRHNNLSMSDL